MKNRPFFIPSKYRQPDNYKKFFSNWAAIYRHNGTEYHVEFITNIFSRDNAGHMDILVQTPTCRRVVSSDIKSIKKAVETLEKIIGKESAS